ncbi:hypothetical protein HRR83_007562 [Exophiala dermatitidis]|nr:hypothetical protein HRR74_007201 [Exophiala dermatitidis]KAJ4521700.1 hypothetical protein HRR73_002898 [Exophiala dermatitidis]KAJ4539390.1 hypothetical protein HRR77_006278 [Exophiala dermatitidis]KAJ4548532.1 hypothetical protein HRR76_001126 [Exophiala dermatitidis]KAJ4562811.1 hypothetical protein HRR79_006411 [Exophiala dermatitidis]
MPLRGHHFNCHHFNRIRWLLIAVRIFQVGEASASSPLTLQPLHAVSHVEYAKGLMKGTSSQHPVFGSSGHPNSLHHSECVESVVTHSIQPDMAAKPNPPQARGVPHKGDQQRQALRRLRLQ